MFEDLLKQYQNLFSILGLVAVLFMLTLGGATALLRKKSAAKKIVKETVQVAAKVEHPELEAEMTEAFIVTKVSSEPKAGPISYSMEEILNEPTEEELAIAKAI